MRFLELFCGTKSMSKAFEARGHEVRTLDIDPRHRPTYCMDIMDLEADTLGDWIPDGIHASPDCTYFTVASLSRNWKYAFGHYVPRSEGAFRSMVMVAKTLQVIHDLEPVWFTIENPMGMLRKTGLMDGLKLDPVTYCQYGDTAQKPTDIWNDLLTWTPRPRCKPRSPCHTPAPRGSRNPGSTQGKGCRIERARIPAQLCEEIAIAAERQYELLTTADGRFEKLHEHRDLPTFDVEAGRTRLVPDLPTNDERTRWKAVKTSCSTNSDRSSCRQATLEGGWA